MQRAFLTRAPTANELTLLRKYLATYRDGTGGQREADGSSRADPRQIERCFAELLHGTTTENKFFYDFVIETNESGGIAVRGASIKSKEISKLLEYPRKPDSMRAHLEISNSAAKDWGLCAEHGLTEEDFRNHRRAADFGSVILQRQNYERLQAERSYTENSGKFFVHQDCVFISVLYSKPDRHNERHWMVSAFNVLLKPPKSWEFSGKALIGKDEDGEKLYEWYALSGSQFKYYPKIATRLNGSDLFTLPKPAIESLRMKAGKLFGE